MRGLSKPKGLKTKLTNKLGRLSSQQRMVLFIIIFAAIGSIILLAVNAVSPNVSFEPENSTINGPATVCSDSTASNDGCVQFKTASSGGAPPSPAAIGGVQLCNNGPDAAAANGAGLLPPTKYQTQPTLAQVKADFPAITNLVIISNDISEFNLAANTAYWFTPGVHAIHHQIFPAQNDVFIGGYSSSAGKAIIDGGHASTFSFTHANGVPFDHVTIQYLTIRNYKGQTDSSVINQDSGAYWTISHNTIGPNDDGAGIAGGAHETITYNCITQNGQYGINGYDAQHGHPGDTMVIDHNEFDTNNVRTIPASAPLGAGCENCGYDNYPTPTTRNLCTGACGSVYNNGASGGMKLWDFANVKVTNNYIHHNHNVGIWADGNNVGVQIENNYISNNWAQGVFYEISYNPTIKNNAIVNNAAVEGPRLAGGTCCGSFPVGGIYISEAGWDSRVNHYCPTTCGSDTSGEISGNNVKDNWSGIVAWENSDRYCSDFQCGFSSTKQMYSSGVTPTQCKATVANGGIEPSWDCRWNVQNLNIHDNIFQFDRTTINNWISNLKNNGDSVASTYPIYTNILCTGAHYCGQTTTVSQYSSTAWWPGDTVGCAITWGNRSGSGSGHDTVLSPSVKFHNNTYIGQWKWDVAEVNQSGNGATIPWSQWIATVGSVSHCVSNSNSEDHPAQDANSVCYIDSTKSTICP